METDKRVVTPILFVYWFGLQNLRRHLPMLQSNKKQKSYRGHFDRLSVSIAFTVQP